MISGSFRINAEKDCFSSVCVNLRHLRGTKAIRAWFDLGHSVSIPRSIQALTGQAALIYHERESSRNPYLGSVAGLWGSYLRTFDHRSFQKPTSPPALPLPFSIEPVLLLPSIRAAWVHETKMQRHQIALINHQWLARKVCGRGLR